MDVFLYLRKAKLKTVRRHEENFTLNFIGYFIKCKCTILD